MASTPCCRRSFAVLLEIRIENSQQSLGDLPYNAESPFDGATKTGFSVI